MENYKDALNSFNKSLSLMPDDPEILNLKGNILYYNGEYKEALDCYNRSLKIEPNNEGARNNRKVLMKLYNTE